MTVIAVRDVSKSFKQIPLLEKVNFDINEGGSYALVGPNGSGKSVLLKLMCHFLAPDRGRVDIDPAFLSSRRTFPASFGITIDGPAYLPHRTAEENLLELARIRGVVGIREVRTILDQLDLRPQHRLRARNLSQGMKQKLALAQALMEEPSVLILDEPFNALDTESAEQVRAILKREKARGTTIVFTSHVVGDVEDLADEVLEILGRTVTVR